jgi:SGNH domain (fused to AT3 domains)
MRNRLFGIIATVALVTGTATLASGASLSGPLPSVLKTQLAASSSIDSVDVTKTVPPLASIGTFDFSYNPSRYGCTTLQTQEAPIYDAATRCAYGDLKAKRTIALFGDSQAEMWLPAFDMMGQALQWKVVYFAKAGCAPWVNTVPGDFTIIGKLTHRICQNFVTNEIADVIAVHPKVIVPVGLEGSVATKTAPTTAVLTTQIKALLTALAPAHATTLFLKPIAEYIPSITSQTPTTCLTAHQGALSSCALTPADLTKDPVYPGLMAAASATGTTVVDTARLFCSPSLCPLIVQGSDGVHLVYNDATHINRWYSQYISRSFANLVRPSLPGA